MLLSPLQIWIRYHLILVLGDGFADLPTYESKQIASFISSHCRDGAQIVLEMERNLFEHDYFPFMPMARNLAHDDSHGYSDQTTGHSSSLVHAHGAVNEGSSASLTPTNNPLDTTDNPAHIASLEELVFDSSQNEGANEIEETIEKRSLALLKMEKTMLEGLSTKDFDGNYILDSLLYLVVVPVSDDQYVVR